MGQSVSVSPNPRLLTETLALHVSQGPATPSRGEYSHSEKSKARPHAGSAICSAPCALLPLQVPQCRPALGPLPSMASLSHWEALPGRPQRGLGAGVQS